jgi:hypothetical protein
MPTTVTRFEHDEISLFSARDFSVATADDIGVVFITLDIRTISLMLILRDLFCADVKCRNGARA